ncbi:hypothetical protein [Bordetella sp. FB-8]|uniref:hypothetical protein n=1 Tax=Bordetella sp. FB-8 TaxID=1159870 RepID=UPI0012DC2EB7|nr:hypothetical protein [Bordetella sp. FB-8]
MSKDDFGSHVFSGLLLFDGQCESWYRFSRLFKHYFLMEEPRMPRFHKFDIARSQLVTATEIFFNQQNFSAVITLAGAASGILDELVRREGKEPFVDYMCRIHRELAGATPARQSAHHHIENRLGISAHKHLSHNDTPTVQLDLERLATDALVRAISDYIALKGQDEAFVKAVLQWVWKNSDGEAMMEQYRAVPMRQRPRT